MAKRSYKTDVKIASGDITQLNSDAIITTINHGGLWYGSIDQAIRSVAGSQYHCWISNKRPLKDLDVIVAKGDKRAHNGKFDNVIFVVDDLESSLDKVIYNGLEAAHNQKYENVTIPTIRMGARAGVVEKTPRKAASKLVEGIREFQSKYDESTTLKNITIVVYNNPTIGAYLRNAS